MDPHMSDTIRDTAENARKVVGGTVDKLTDQARDQVDDLSNVANDFAKKGLEIAKDQMATFKAQASSFAKDAEKSIHKNPLAAVAIAAGAGMLIAGLAGVAIRSLGRPTT